MYSSTVKYVIKDSETELLLSKYEIVIELLLTLDFLEVIFEILDSSRLKESID